jgi:hypothetical protein
MLNIPGWRMYGCRAFREKAGSCTIGNVAGDLTDSDKKGEP